LFLYDKDTVEELLLFASKGFHSPLLLNYKNISNVMSILWKSSLTTFLSAFTSLLIKAQRHVIRDFHTPFFPSIYMYIGGKRK